MKSEAIDRGLRNFPRATTEQRDAIRRAMSQEIQKDYSRGSTNALQRAVAR
jgi:hypothetical protein